MCTNEGVQNTVMSLTIDELRWLQFSRAMDLPSRSSSPPPVLQNPQYEPSQSHDASIPHNQNPKLSYGSSKSFHLRGSLEPASKSLYKSSSISIRAESTLGYPGSPSSNLSRSLPSGSSCQEWIYRRPNKITGHAQPSRQVIPISSRVRPPHYMDQGKQVRKPQMVIETRDDEPNATPFWSTLLRSRSRSDRSVPSLKARPSRAQIIISRPFTSLPTISPNPIETTLIPTTQHPHLRTPSITSTASTASTSSTRLGTPTMYSFSRNAKRHRRSGARPIPLDPFTGQHAKLEIDYPPLSSSCPPSKSILASVSVGGSHTTSATSGLSQNKSVKFVDIPTVHYASTAGWHSSDMAKIGASQHGNDAHMGIDVEGMDIDHDIHLPSSDVKALCNSPERAIEVLYCTPTPEKEVGRTTTLKRLTSLKQRSAIERGKPVLSLASRRPTISGPYALGTVQPMSTNGTATFIPPLSLPERNKEPSLPLPPTVIPDQTRLRNAPSLESVKSTRSIGARSVLSLGSTKGAAGIRGIRTWIENNITPNIRLNFGSGWSLT